MIAGHESLYQADILQRDMSLGNILEENESDVFLIDLSLALNITPLEASGAPGKAGPKFFTAIDALYI